MQLTAFRGRVVPRGRPLELHFHTAELREICEKRAVAATKLGYTLARELAERLADIEVLETVGELCDLLGKAIYDQSPSEKCLRLTSGFVVVFRSAHPSQGGMTSQVPDWDNTTRIMIVGIENVDG